MNRKTWLLSVLGAISAFLFCSFLGVLKSGAAPSQRQEIARLAELMEWKPGTIVADIGAGDGSFSFVAAEKVGPTGRVYATEIDSDKLKQLRSDVLKRKLANVIVVEGAVDDTKLPSECCDAIYLRHVYHHLTQPVEFDRNLVRSLKTGARLAIIDFPANENLPPVEGVPKNRGGHGIPQKLVVDELTSAGLQVEKVVADWSANDYCVLFEKRGP
jgi:ubiquinone/menaquinone biosynthesis C-methylase UbiE